MELFKDGDCRGTGQNIASAFLGGSIESFKNVSLINSLVSFRIHSTADTSYYIGRSIYDYNFKVDESDFPSVQSLIDLQMKEEAPKISESIVFPIASMIPIFGDLLAVVPILEQIFIHDSDDDWKQHLIEHIGDAIDQTVAKNAIDQIESEMSVIVENINFAKNQNFCEKSLNDMIIYMNNRLIYIVNYMLTKDGIFRKYPLHSINPLLTLTKLVSIYRQLTTDEKRKSSKPFEHCRQLVNDFHKLGISARLDRFKTYGHYQDAVNKLKTTPYTGDEFSNSKRILCMPPGSGGSPCVPDDLNAETDVWSHTFDATDCYVGYAKLVKYRFEQAYAPLLHLITAF